MLVTISKNGSLKITYLLFSLDFRLKKEYHSFKFQNKQVELMRRSMTAYGRAGFSNDLGAFQAEIQSLNRRYLEINVFLPKQLSFLETEVRKRVSQKIFRGAITIKISAQFTDTSPTTVVPNLPLAKQVRAAWEKIAEALDMPREEVFRLEMFQNEPNVLIYQENFANEEIYREAIFHVLDDALAAAIKMKETEGEYIQKDMAKRIALIEGWVKEIEKKAPESVDKYRIKISEKIKELLQGQPEIEERILREITLYADKVDITEELTRLKSHQKQFLKLLAGSEESIGKTLEFLLQEMQREANTINAKAAEADIAQLAVNVKGELEKIREQVQNIE